MKFKILKMEPEILAIVGGRDFSDKERLYAEVDEYRKYHNVIGITSGVSIYDPKFKGADTLAIHYARDKDLKYIGFPANWTDMSEPCRIKFNSFGKAYNALAGMNRNTKIVETATTTVMAFWDGKSKGTLDSITKAKDMGKAVIEINY